MLAKTTFLKEKEEVEKMMATENSYYVSGINDFPTLVKFNPAGISSAGARLRFPASFINTLKECNHEDLANDILMTRAGDYFDRTKGTLLVREFGNEVHGVLTDKYSIFDDDEVMNILNTSEYLMNAEEVWGDISPSHLHLRFISGNMLYIDGDKSPLSMAVFVDNSMTGESSLKIRFGIYRWACTNGVIAGFKEFNILREVHHGTKDYARLLNDALMQVEQYEEMMLKKVEEMSVTKSSIYQMSEEDAVRYIKDKLNIGKKNAQIVFDAYTNEYGGETKWDLCNAITFVAHNLESIDERLRYEATALKVA